MRPPEPITPLAPRELGRILFRQSWEQLTFLHWRVEPERVQSYLPPGTRPDTFDGATWVGLIPFMMRRIAVLRGPALPYVGSFCETNIRLYSVDDEGRRGVVFVSLDASRLAPVLTARWGPNLPYLWSRMRLQQNGSQIEYDCRRRWPGPRGTTSRIVAQIGEPIAEPSPLEHFLTARWGLHGRSRRWTARSAAPSWYWPNDHEQWPLHRATLTSIDDNLLAAAGFGELAARGPDSVLWSPGVHARFGPRTVLSS